MNIDDLLRVPSPLFFPFLMITLTSALGLFALATAVIQEGKTKIIVCSALAMLIPASGILFVLNAPPEPRAAKNKANVEASIQDQYGLDLDVEISYRYASPDQITATEPATGKAYKVVPDAAGELVLQHAPDDVPVDPQEGK